MRMFKHSPMALSLALALGLSAFTQAESLKDTYQQALENDHTFKAAKASYEAGKENKNIGRAGLLPNISGEATLSEVSTDNETTTRISESDQATILSGSPDTSVQGYTVTLAQPLINFAAWHSYKQAKAATKAATAQFHAAEQDLIVRTAKAYFDVLKAADNLETARAEENALSHQLEQTKQRFEVGLTAITEVHEAQAAYDSAMATRLIAEGQLGIAFEGLEVITGQSYQTLQPLRKNFPVTPPSPNKREEWVAFALENNFSLKAASASADSAKQQAKVQRAGHLPTLSATLSYDDKETDITNFTNNQYQSKTDVQNQTISLRLSVPIFSGGRTSASRRQAYANAMKAREEFNQNQRDVIQQTRSLHLSVVTGVATVKARAQAITSSQSALDATQAGYEVGTRDLVDVLNAQRSLYRAQRDYLDTLYSYILSSLQLKQSAGTLTPKAVDELDALLDREKTVQRF